MARYEAERNFLKSNFNQFKNIKTDKMKGVPQPILLCLILRRKLLSPLPGVQRLTGLNGNMMCLGFPKVYT